MGGMVWFPANNMSGPDSAPAASAKWLVSEDKFGRDYVCRRRRRGPNLVCLRMVTNEARQAIAEFGRKYLWWKPVGDQPHSKDRIIAQTMNLGTCGWLKAR